MVLQGTFIRAAFLIFFLSLFLIPSQLLSGEDKLTDFFSSVFLSLIASFFFDFHSP